MATHRGPRIPGVGKFTYICNYCHEEYKTPFKDRNKYCCREHAFADKHEISECKKQMKASTVPMQTCVYCGKLFEGPLNKRYCCYECCYRAYYSAKRGVFEGGIKCKACGEYFYPEFGDKRRSYCSDTCAKANHRKNYRQSEKGKLSIRTQNARRRARLHGVYSETINPLFVFTRDHWTCGICGQLVDKNAKVPDPKAPTIDHIMPLSRGGKHIYSNIQCAHFICNSSKGNHLTGAVQISTAL